MKHLSFTERCMIERYLCLGYSFRDIAVQIDRQTSTISREIKNYRYFIHPRNALCVNFHDCRRKALCTECTSDAPFCKMCMEKECHTLCERFAASHCTKLDKAPFVCNHCSQRNSCTKQHAYYNARKADARSHAVLSASRESIHLDEQEVIALNELVTPLIRNGQSPSHIFMNHQEELGISKTTLYDYINRGILDVRNIDLPLKVRYKKRKAKRKESFQYKFREGRTYEDFKKHMEMNPDDGVVEMDTVIGKREKGKCLLTMIFVKYEFMLIFLLDSCSQDSVREVFESLQRSLGLMVYKKLFPVILTDNGKEFMNPGFMETTVYGAPCTNVFYCDAMASWQKPHVENNHHLIRRILPKGTSFDKLTQEQVTLMMNHINNYARENLDGKSPYECIKSFIGPKTIKVLGLRKIPSEQICLKPALLK
ncbi:MAG: IS30 family transposase [Oscillospiraceae bacterium]|nr:IS30 family transposase [Oscillospiraceae bacterium]